MRLGFYRALGNSIAPLRIHHHASKNAFRRRTYENKYPLGTTMRPHLAVELKDEQMIGQVETFEVVTIIYGENDAFFSRMDRRTQPLIEL